MLHQSSDNFSVQKSFFVGPQVPEKLFSAVFDRVSLVSGHGGEFCKLHGQHEGEKAEFLVFGMEAKEGDDIFGEEFPAA